MTNAIVTVNVSQTSAPVPNTLQKTGAFISQGGTTLTPGSLSSPITQLADLVAILSTAVGLASLSLSAGVVTATTTAPHGWGTGDTINVVQTGNAPAAYNGMFAATITGANTYTYPLGGSPGVTTHLGSVILESEVEDLAMGTTYFAGNGVQSVYVLELGEGTVAEGVAALQSYITQNPSTVYTYLVPREWDANSGFIALAREYTAPNAKTYFFVTTTVANAVAGVYAGIKSVLAIVEAPSIPPIEFSLAAELAVTLAYNPGSTNKVPPLSYAFLYGVTPYPSAGNQSIFAELLAANVGWVGTGAEGGLPSATIVQRGHTQDGNPFNYWYSVDWAQINIQLGLANEIINGSNNKVNPLYYNQQGINRLQNKAAQIMGSAVTNGLALGSVVKTTLPAQQFNDNLDAGLYVGQLVINAEPFLVYSQENPNDYAQGVYNGLSCVYTPLRGFETITFDLNVTNFVSA